MFPGTSHGLLQETPVPGLGKHFYHLLSLLVDI